MAGGGEAFVPPGLFVLHGRLTVPPGVTLRGSYGSVPSHSISFLNDKIDQLTVRDGSVLIPTGGRGSTGCSTAYDDLNCTVTFITISANALVRGLVVYYQEQETVQLPVPYPCKCIVMSFCVL